MLLIARGREAPVDVQPSKEAVDRSANRWSVGESSVVIAVSTASATSSN
jgi:hypothetical protein